MILKYVLIFALNKKLLAVKTINNKKITALNFLKLIFIVEDFKYTRNKAEKREQANLIFSYYLHKLQSNYS
jgi:hypothetical protein